MKSNTTENCSINYVSRK